MSASTNILDIANQYREALIALETEVTSEILDAYGAIRRDLDDDLQSLTRRIQSRIDAGQDVPVSWLHRQTRYQQLLTQAEAEVASLAAAMNPQITQLQADAALLGDEAARALLGQAGVQITARLPNDALVELVGRLSDGSPLSEWLDDFGPHARKTVGKLLTDAVVRGMNPKQISQEVSRAIGISQVRAETLVRTETITSFRNANLAHYRQHGDVLRGWRWSAQLGDARTCPSCLAQHGKVFPLSKPFASHQNCRCTPVPHTGSATEFPTGPDWFAEQSPSFQMELLGPAKGGAYRDGVISLEDLIQTGTDDRWGPFSHERSLASILGSRADDYYAEAAGG